MKDYLSINLKLQSKLRPLLAAYKDYVQSHYSATSPKEIKYTDFLRSKVLRVWKSCEVALKESYEANQIETINKILPRYHYEFNQDNLIPEINETLKFYNNRSQSKGGKAKKDTLADKTKKLDSLIKETISLEYYQKYSIKDLMKELRKLPSFVDYTDRQLRPSINRVFKKK